MDIIDLKLQPSIFNRLDKMRHKKINGLLGLYIQVNILKYIHNIDSSLIKTSNKL